MSLEFLLSGLAAVLVMVYLCTPCCGPSVSERENGAMSIPGLLQLALFVLVIFAITKPLGLHLWRVFTGQRTLLDPVLGPVERLIYRVSAVDPSRRAGLERLRLC